MPRALERWRYVFCLSSLLVAACRESGAPPIHIVVGPSPADDVTLSPRASLAELIEISPTESVLLLTLSSSPRTCDALPEPEPTAVSVSLRLTLPAGAKLEPGSFPLVQGAPSPDKPSALGMVKVRGARHELRGGGDLVLSQLELSPQGSLEGRLALEFAGDGQHPATRVSGRFLAHFCRINRLR